MGLKEIVRSNKKNLQRDISRFIHLDPLLQQKEIEVSLNGKKGKINVSFDVQTSNKDIQIDGILVFPDHTEEKLPLIKSTISDSGRIDYEFIQDVSLDGKAKTFEEQLSQPYDYQSIRNQFCQKLHTLLDKHYANTQSKNLIKGIIKQKAT